jgi:small-conductance mechanosensitive channel
MSHPLVELVGPSHAVQVFGVKLVGVTAENGRKLLFTIVFVVLMVIIGRLLRAGVDRIVMRRRGVRVRFWVRQGIHLGVAAVLAVGVASIWFDDPTRLATALGLITAGLAFALQRVVTAMAGYVVILRGRTFSVGDRITMGGVRGDVIALGFIQTTIMEMGQPPAVEDADPAMWVRARQYTGRIVTVSNAKIFEEPVYNYTRDFPYIWEEIRVPIPYRSDHARGEAILLETARRHTVDISGVGEAALAAMERRYVVTRAELGPRVFVRLTDNWIELAVRFLVTDHGVRQVKDAMSRDILTRFAEAGISIASATSEIVGLPPLRVHIDGRGPETSG